MNSCELVTLISTIACAISKGKTIEELSLWAAFFTQLGDSLATIAVANNFPNCNDTTSFNSSSTTSSLKDS